MTPLTRRAFLAAASSSLALARLDAIEPLERTGKAKLTASLAAYSFNRYLSLTGKKKPTMTLEEFIDFAAKLELPAVELTAYYFAKTSDDYLKDIRKRCSDANLAVSGTAIGNDFCWPDEKKQKEQMEYAKQWIERSAVLGAKTIRIFAGTQRKPDTEADARKRCVSYIEKACEIAGKHKIVLALENHGGITATSDSMLEIVKAVKSEHFGVNLDSGNFHTKDPYKDLEAIAPYAVVAQIKTEIISEQPAKDKGKPTRKREEADLKRLTNILRKVAFQGYVALEYEAAEDPKVAVPRYVKELKQYMG